MPILRPAALTGSRTPALRLLAPARFALLAGAVTLVGLPLRPVARRRAALHAAITRTWVRRAKRALASLQQTKTAPAFTGRDLLYAGGWII
jgi:hypothetical protein